MRRYIALSFAVISFTLLTGSSCEGTGCPDDSEAVSVSSEMKPTCKPVNKAPKWVGPSSTVKS